MISTARNSVGAAVKSSLVRSCRPKRRSYLTHNGRTCLLNQRTFATLEKSTLGHQQGNGIQANTSTITGSGSAPRLLKTSSYELVAPDNVATDSIAYAILSHTWRMEKDEITLKEISPDALQGTMAREAFTKIRLTCDQAKRDGLEYVWIDTCCIDKSSSADLSEAINSMYAWYASARVCYVYMSDVGLAGGQEAFRQSRWFTRAWTLQELLAPTELRFYDKDWKFLGRLSHPKCASVVSDVTGIDTGLILHRRRLADYSVAQRMSWAAHRHATRIEDRAYSLLGIFDVQMPMIYGEGWKSFVRLQEEIIKASTDHTIFCWNAPAKERGENRRLLAQSPSQFAGCNDIEQVSVKSHRAYQMTNRGLEITLPMIAYTRDLKNLGRARVRLNCAYRDDIEQAKQKATALRPKIPKRIVLNLQRQYDLDAEMFDDSEPWIWHLQRKWRDLWDDMMIRLSDFHTDASHAWRAYAIGHSSQDPRLEYGDDNTSRYREQTIVVLRDCTDGAGMEHWLQNSSPVETFVFGVLLYSYGIIIGGVVILFMSVAIDGIFD